MECSGWSYDTLIYCLYINIQLYHIVYNTLSYNMKQHNIAFYGYYRHMFQKN